MHWSYPTSRNAEKVLLMCPEICIRTFIVMSFIMGLFVEWINRSGNVHTMKSYTAMKKDPSTTAHDDMEES